MSPMNVVIWVVLALELTKTVFLVRWLLRLKRESRDLGRRLGDSR